MGVIGWKFYNHAAVPTSAPHEDVNIQPIKTGEIWNIDEKKPLFVRWTSDFDCPYETNWWYIIKDKPFDINTLKSKRRYEINKGLKNYVIKEINPIDYIESLYHITEKAYLSWPAKYRPRISLESFSKEIKKWDYSAVLGAFDINTGLLCGYAALRVKGYFIDFVTLRVIPDEEKKAINAAIIAGILAKYKDQLGKGYYICDGSRSIMHETAFQDYLQKYFGFRKAYCKLHIIYRNPIGMIVKIVYPFRKLIHSEKGALYQLCCVMKMEEIVRTDRYIK